MPQTEQILNILIVVSGLVLLPGFWQLGRLIVRWAMARYVRKHTLIITVKGTDGQVHVTKVSATDSLIDKLMLIDDHCTGRGGCSHG
ncbi:hypothetical protein ADINL_1232 [Nitrincola lacisaponensis]|uniref:Uncharacterized protein n=1 Tax=Nitrincola lacisaponensis TaxID=267850 RepID=A0A063Y662_9GAMM|nr:hypothetical protein ADINL_1232 [Nitrincola lacisaponensis]